MRGSSGFSSVAAGLCSGEGVVEEGAVPVPVPVPVPAVVPVAVAGVRLMSSGGLEPAGGVMAGGGDVVVGVPGLGQVADVGLLVAEEQAVVGVVEEDVVAAVEE